MTEPEHDDELTEPDVADVPEPDQDPEEAEAEAEAVELEQDDGTSHDDRGVERAFVSLQKEATRHANRISQIMGDDAQMLEPCPRCVTTDPQRPPTPGFIWPHTVVPLLPADKALVKRSIGEGEEPEYKPNDDAFQCVKCLGEGKYPTGSKVPAERFIRCDTCDGRGWIGQRSLGAPTPAYNGSVEAVAVGVSAETPKPDSDPWGRLPGDPLYGVLPGFER